MKDAKLKFFVMKFGFGLSLILAFFSGVFFLLKNRLADQTMVSLVMVLAVTFIYWFLMLRCTECDAHLYSSKPCDNCGKDPME